MTRVAVSADAQLDRDDILLYLEREAGASVAEKYALRFRDALKRLQEYPKIGQTRPVLGPHTRVMVIAPYLIIYDYKADIEMVTVLRILHGKRRITIKPSLPSNVK